MRYEELKQYREQNIQKQATHQQLNDFHDKVMKNTVELAIKKVEKEQGQIPAPFAFFIMGSAGRMEQSVWSDQDHGIIYAGDEEEKEYFLFLGKEIVSGLEEVGYERCDGKVMASESMWTNSIDNWENQVMEWLDEASWQSLRHFLTFFDSRVLIGKQTFLTEIKQSVFIYIKSHPDIVRRLIDNVAFIKKGVGVFGQLLPEQIGKMAGQINIKTTTLFPYVNSLRLLALINQEPKASTLARFRALQSKYSYIEEYRTLFESLLEFKLPFAQHANNYEEVHYIPIKQLSKSDKQVLKEYIKTGTELFNQTKNILKEECLKWE
ncbi:signal transduction protein [Gracilibacillus boraciitolerans JCM 21714]|uniref:Signal transduction protein n=1 Tax=Gracilibacillus boraciitolerans JCM 21714 TaxID=1298598 RepID=W4VNM5_9BACI|nr:DUF294 nucleotidyltransferase-like domain-containing protein [Gracilibacillus boraciitolerans]GAE94965.1 signal transduction protein [Gracilibacillus boraciitolerans JCM 21714]